MVNATANGTGSIENVHPLYGEFTEDWTTMRDVYRGERVVKAAGQRYLPPTAGMILDGMNKKTDIGYIAYEAYKCRAVFPDYTKEGVEALVGMLHMKEAVIELPPQLEPLRTKATLNNESLQDLLRRINTEQLVTGRIGLLADVAENPTPGEKTLPYIASYIAEAIVNWDDSGEAEDHMSLNMVVLNESGFIREDVFTWKELKKYRVLMLGDPLDNERAGAYTMGTFTDQGPNANELNFNTDAMKVPMFMGAKLEHVPFVFINTKDIVASPDEAPLLGLAKTCLAIYRGEADYRQALHLQGQDTLVVVGGTRSPDGTAGDDPDAIRVGAGSRIDVDIQGDAKYIGVSGAGLPEMRTCLENDRKDAQGRAGKLVPNSKADAESGEALKTRISAQTATLNQIAWTAAKGLQNILASIAKWVGADPATVKVTPNLDFGDFDLGAKDLVDLMSARQLGAPISRESIHAVMVDRGMTRMKYEDELDKIEEEDARNPPPGSVGQADQMLTVEEKRLKMQNENQPPADEAK